MKKRPLSNSEIFSRHKESFPCRQCASVEDSVCFEPLSPLKSENFQNFKTDFMLQVGVL